MTGARIYTPHLIKAFKTANISSYTYNNKGGQSMTYAEGLYRRRHKKEVESTRRSQRPATVSNYKNV